VEQLLPGLDGRSALAADGGPLALEAALAAVEELHRRTAVEVIVDERLLRAWVDEPLERLAGWLGARDTGGDDLAAVREFLREGLAGRSESTGWIHGDLSPGNLLFDDEGRRVEGLVDWEWASPEGLPGVDVVHLLLTVRMLREGKELGPLVTGLLASRPADGAADADAPLEGADADSRLADPVLVLLTWLHHVAGIVSRSDRYPPGSLWAARNVEVVLQRVREGCLEGSHRA
jgi:hypothetical protein